MVFKIKFSEVKIRSCTHQCSKQRHTHTQLHLLKRDKSLTSSTSLTVIHGSVCNGELTEVLSNHLGLDLYGNVLLSVVHSDDTTDHLRKNDDITKMSLDGGGLLLDSVVSDLGTVDGLLDLVHQSDLLGLDTVSEFSTNSGSQMRKKLLVLLVHAHLHELVQLETAEAEFLEYTTFTGTGLFVCWCVCLVLEMTFESGDGFF